jgi:hypothetical protein
VKFRRWLGWAAKLARPLLRLIGVKDKTVAGKVAEGIEVIDKVIPPEK